MNRLTARAGNGLAYLAKVKDNEQSLVGSYNTLFCVREAFEKLAYLEDGNFEERAIRAEKICRLHHLRCVLSYNKEDFIEGDTPPDFEDWMDDQFVQAKEVLGDE